MSAAARPYISQEDYLRMENASPTKNEYYQGAIYPVDMSGATSRHNRLVANLIGELYGQLKDSGCSVYPSDMRVHVRGNTYYTYPDVVVVCGEGRFLEENEMTLVNPTLIIEVLSPSTAHIDRGSKFGLYRDLESLREYVLVAQDERKVETFFLGDHGAWEPREFTSGAVRFLSIAAEVALDDLYAGVQR